MDLQSRERKSAASSISVLSPLLFDFLKNSTALSPNLRAKTARFINPCLFVLPIGTSLSNKYDFNFSTPQLLKLSSSFSASSRSSDAILEMMPPFRPILLCEIDLFNMASNIRKMAYFKVARETGTVPVSKGTMGLFWGTLSFLLSVSTFVKL